MLCWTIIGERQAARMRGLYLKAILRQDIAFFDTEMSTGEVIGRMSGDIILIQQTMGVKVNFLPISTQEWKKINEHARNKRLKKILPLNY